MLKFRNIGKSFKNHINVTLSSSVDILTCSQAQDDNIPSMSSSYVSPQTIKPYPKASRELRGRKNTKKAKPKIFNKYPV